MGGLAAARSDAARLSAARVSCALFLGIGGFARAPLQVDPAVPQLAGDAGAGMFQRGGAIAGGFVLGLAQQDVAGDRAFQPGLEAAVIIQQDHRFALVRQPMHEGGRDQHVAEGDQAGQMMQRHLQALFPFHVDAHVAFSRCA
jgi:hypothetical protein